MSVSTPSKHGSNLVQFRSSSSSRPETRGSFGRPFSAAENKTSGWVAVARVEVGVGSETQSRRIVVVTFKSSGGVRINSCEAFETIVREASRTVSPGRSWCSFGCAFVVVRRDRSRRKRKRVR